MRKRNMVGYFKLNHERGFLSFTVYCLWFIRNTCGAGKLSGYVNQMNNFSLFSNPNAFFYLVYKIVNIELFVVYLFFFV